MQRYGSLSSEVLRTKLSVWKGLYAMLLFTRPVSSVHLKDLTELLPVSTAKDSDLGYAVWGSIIEDVGVIRWTSWV